VSTGWLGNLRRLVCRAVLRSYCCTDVTGTSYFQAYSARWCCSRRQHSLATLLRISTHRSGSNSEFTSSAVHFINAILTLRRVQCFLATRGDGREKNAELWLAAGDNCWSRRGLTTLVSPPPMAYIATPGKGVSCLQRQLLLFTRLARCATPARGEISMATSSFATRFQ